MKINSTQKREIGAKARSILSGLMCLVLAASIAFPAGAISALAEGVAEDNAATAETDVAVVDEQDGNDAEESSGEQEASDDQDAKESEENKDDSTDENKEDAQDEPEASDVVVTDEKSGVTVTIPAASMPEGVASEDVAVRVSELSSKEFNSALKLVKKDKSEVVEALDISLYNKSNNKEIQPSDGNTVTVSVAGVEGLKDDVQVQRVNDDKTVTELSGSVDGREVSFETEHFTVYVFSNNPVSGEYVASYEQLKSVIDNNSGDIEIVLKDDITWPSTHENWQIIRTGSNKNITIRSYSSSDRKSIRRSSATRGTMFWVYGSATLTFKDVIIDGYAGDYFGNANQGWNGIDDRVRGVFVYNEGVLTLDSGAEMVGAHAQVDYNYYGGSQNSTAELTKLAAPIFSQGGTVNMKEGSSIHGSWFTAKARSGGNAFSAGAIIAAPGHFDSAPSTINMEGGRIYDNKVGWDTNPAASGDKNIYKDMGGTPASANQTGEATIPDNGYMHPNVIRKGSTFDSWQNTFASTDMYNHTYGPTNGAVEKRTPGVGGILLLSSNLNMSGGSIEYNSGETGAIGVNGVGGMWKDLYTDEGGDTLQWSGENGVGLSGPPDSLKSVFKLTGGTINGNTGLTNGGVYVGRYGEMIMGEEDKINQDNDKITISHNRSIADYGGAGIGLIGQTDYDMLKWVHYDFNNRTSQIPSKKDSAENEPKLTMYSGTIRENHSTIKGGGIYVATDNANMYGGQILRNKADMVGGGMYVEMGFHTTFQSVVNVTNNTADHEVLGTFTDADRAALSNESTRDELREVQGKGYGWDGKDWDMGNAAGGGGGIWLCPEGDSIFDIDKLLIHDNTASASGDDLYKVVNRNFPNTGILNLPDANPAGGKTDWYRDGGLTEKNGYVGSTNIVDKYDASKENSTMLPANGTSTLYPRYSSSSEQITGQETQYDAIAVKAISDSATISESASYSSLLIDGNISSRGGGIGADGRLRFGEDTGEYTKHSIGVEKEWAKNSGTYIQPVKIKVYAKISDIERRLIQTIELNRENGYKGTLDGIPTRIRVGAGANDFVELFIKDSNGDYIPNPNGLILVEDVNGEDDPAKIPYQTSQAITFNQSVEVIVDEDNPNNPNGSYTVKRTIYSYNSKVGNRAKQTWPVNISKKALAASGMFLEGAKLKIVAGEDADGDVVYDNITSENKAMEYKLQAGTYTLVEVEAPSDYDIADPITFRVDDEGKVYIKQGGSFTEVSSKTITMVDERSPYRVKVKKTWAEGTTPQAIQVQLLADGEPAANQTSGFTNTVTLNSDNNWTYVWEGSEEYPLDPDKTYTIKELTTSSEFAPSMGTVAKSWKEVNTFTAGTSVILARNNDDGSKAFIGKKSSTETWNELDLLGSSKTVQYNEDGNILAPSLDLIWDVESNDNGTFRLVNRATGEKIAAATNNGALAQKAYDFTHTVNFTSEELSVTTDKVDQLTFQDGVLSLDGNRVRWYIYTDYMTINPASNPSTFTVYEQTDTVKQEDSEYLKVLHLENKKGRANIKLVKVDATDTTIPVPGAKFQLQDTEGNVINTVTSGADGVIDFGDVPYGTYQVVETEVPAPYQLNSSPIELVVDENGMKFNGSYSNATIMKSTTHSTSVDEADSSRLYTMTGDNSEVRVKGTTTIDAPWAVCMNQFRSLPNTSQGLGEFVKFTNVNHATMETLVDKKQAVDDDSIATDPSVDAEFTEEDYKAVQRTLYHYLTNYDGKNTTELRALLGTQYASPTNVRVEMQNVLRFYTDGKLQAPYSSELKALQDEFMAASKSADKDAEIAEKLNIIIYADQSRSDDKVINSDKPIKKVQNMIYAELTNDSTQTTIRVTNTPAEPDTFTLPSAGGEGIWAWLIAGLALLVAAVAGLVVMNRRRTRGQHEI